MNMKSKIDFTAELMLANTSMNIRQAEQIFYNYWEACIEAVRLGIIKK